MTCETEKSGRGSPVNLFGGGGFGFVDAIKVDPTLRRKIVIAELGGYCVKPAMNVNQKRRRYASDQST
jgi:hypothetical protein